jgi:hypothetical protein
MSPSLFVLGWMAVVSCSLVQTGRADTAAVLLSALTCLVAMMSEAGSVEAERAKKSRVDVWLQGIALAAFVVRLAVFGLRLR